MLVAAFRCGAGVVSLSAREQTEISGYLLPNLKKKKKRVTFCLPLRYWVLHQVSPSKKNLCCVSNTNRVDIRMSNMLLGTIWVCLVLA